jgi:hypothetical protein
LKKTKGLSAAPHSDNNAHEIAALWFKWFSQRKIPLEYLPIVFQREVDDYLLDQILHEPHLKIMGEF